jgi:hypothetical protein
MAVPLAGQLVRASHYPKTRVIKKAASESVTSSTTFQDDDDFTVSLEANRVYRIQVRLSVGGATAGDFKAQWVVTGGVAQYTARHCMGPGVSTTGAGDGSVRSSVHNLSTSVTYGCDGSSNGAVFEDFLVETVVGAAAGTLTLQWAQSASSGTATTMTTSSFMVVEEVEEI